MKVGVVGLGLIGGSFAKAYKAAGHTVYASNRTKQTLDYAVLSGTVDGELTDERLAECDLILIALYPQITIDWLKAHAALISANTMVIDACGTKRAVCAAGFALATEQGFTFVGGHPMAGTARSGFKYATASMFNGASMLIVPPVFDDMALFERVKILLEPANFGRLTVVTAEQHDRVIAFTSQMAHVVSNAYVKSPVTREHKGLSAGSYKDLTRVAWLDENMWTELFLENRDNLLSELDNFIEHIQEYRAALEKDDADRLRGLLAEGKQVKEEVDRSGQR
ncbi:MAG: prephenate dehydrogenase [Coriobacteriia bacterium]|nr:prephenate dehydrogenase [Coriobacteriia bacterium]